MTGPLVSVLLPTYQGVAHVAETLTAVLAQTYGDLEVLVSDDGSTDGTVEAVRAVAGADARVIVDAHENVGIFANPVRLLRRARGDLVKFVLQDDVLHPTCIEVLARPMANPAIVLSTSRRQRIDATGALLPDSTSTTAIIDRDGRLHGRTLGDLLLGEQLNRIGELSTVLYRRSALDADTLWDFPGWAVRGNGDVALHLKVLARGDAWYHPEVLSSFRTHAGQYGSRPEVMIDCTVDWPHLVAGAVELGFLADPAQERRALVHWLRFAGAFHAAVAENIGSDEVLDAMAFAIDRLHRLRSGGERSITSSWPMCSCRNDGSPSADEWSSPASRTVVGT